MVEVCVCGLDLSVHLGIQNIVNDQYEYNEVEFKLTA